jgi:presenilin-like A22 family membrane protease
MERREVVAGVGVAALFLAVQVGALSLVDAFVGAGVQTVDDPSDPTNGLAYFLAILVASGLMLVVIRLGVERLLRWVVLATAGLFSWTVLTVVLPPVGVVAGLHLPALAAGLGLTVALVVHPEWYVLDAAGVVMGAGAAGLFGLTFGVLPAVLLLVALAVYDGVSVYGTEHMLTLAESATDLRIPVLLVVPTSLSFSYVDATADDPTEGDGTDDQVEREGAADPHGDGATDGDPDREDDRSAAVPDALFVGLGDAVMPAVLTASAAVYAPAPRLAAPVLLTVPALGAMAGTLAGLVGLLALVSGGRTHAGLPLLNGGALAGYLLGALAVGVGPATALGL